MREFKPSELPEDTVIKDEKHGVWMKEESGVWGQLTEPYIAGCVMSDTDKHWVLIDDEWQWVTSDMFFQDFKIISLPMAVVEHILLNHDYLSTIDESFEDAMKAVREEQSEVKLVDVASAYPDIQWQHMDSFEDYYMEINEFGQVRTDWDGKVYSPEYNIDLNEYIIHFTDKDGEDMVLDVVYFVKRHFNKDWKP